MLDCWKEISPNVKEFIYVTVATVILSIVHVYLKGGA